ncbi:hypothetical protein [Pacificibacter sp. AS14]|uniref:hypothetical protein n=1 Tax=Pacificibacter sp. AS14 TaxID=3135785 RepID=UPI00316E31B4
MNKINIASIVVEHFATLTDDRSGKVSLADCLTFVGLPLVFAAVAYFSNLPMPSGLTSILVAIFSIFAALLFSSQIALYSLMPRRPCRVNDEILHEKRLKKFKRQKAFFKQVNANTSYLILIATCSLLAFLILEVLPIRSSIEGAVMTFVVAHFFLTLILMIKRTSIAFKIGHELRE